MLPDLDGFEVCRLVREFSSVPIIMLTARAEESDKVRGLNLGADDYLTKPFGAEELLARVKAVLRRARPTPQPRHPTFQTGDLRVDFARHTVTVRGRPVKLSPTEFNLLQYLAIHAGQVLPHEDILKAVWGPEYRDETEYLRVYIRYLRQKIEDDPSHPSYILTEPGVGYMLRAAETAVPSSQRP
jgi:two-component system KDP operon response regulator KdpE